MLAMGSMTFKLNLNIVADFSHLRLDVTNPGLSNMYRWILRPEAPDDGKPAESSLTGSHQTLHDLRNSRKASYGCNQSWFVQCWVQGRPTFDKNNEKIRHNFITSERKMAFR